ncbi:MAG: HigA family addiction module antitoxin, partial [Acidimicrobiales bacterium]
MIEAPPSPGEILAEHLRELKMSQVQLARRMGRPVQKINMLVNGHLRLTPETAIQLSDALDIPPEFWLNLESAYR